MKWLLSFNKHMQKVCNKKLGIGPGSGITGSPTGGPDILNNCRWVTRRLETLDQFIKIKIKFIYITCEIYIIECDKLKKRLI